MLPVGICWSVTKKMGTTQMLGIVLGLTLVSGQLLNAYAVAGTAAADIPKWDFGFVYAPLVITGLHHMSNAIGVGGLPGILSMQPQSMLTFAICMLIAVAVPFALTVMVGKKNFSQPQGA